MCCISVIIILLCRDNKRKLNEQNNKPMELVNDLNNAEGETTLSEKEGAPSSSLDPNDPSNGVEETRTDPEQAELVPPVQSNLSGNFNERVIDQGKNLLEEYPITTVATSQQTSPDLRDNDHQVVVGVSTPTGTNGTFATTGASANRSLGATGDDELAAVNTSPNHVPVPRHNHNAQVNVVPECDTNDPQGTSDLVRPPATWPNLQSPRGSNGHGHEPTSTRSSNLPNGLGPPMPNNGEHRSYYAAL